MCFRKPDITNLTKYLSNGRTAWLWIVDPGWLTLFSTNDVLWNRLPTLAEAELIFWQNLVRNNWIYCVVSDNNDVVTWTAFRCSTSHDLWWVFESNLTHFVDTCFQWEVIVCALLGFFFPVVPSNYTELEDSWDIQPIFSTYASDWLNVWTKRFNH